MSSATAAPQGLACLITTAAWAVAEVVHQPPRRVGVVEVEVAKRLAAVLLGVVPPACRRAAVAGADLVGVLAVAQLLGPLEGGEVERWPARQRSRRRLAGSASSSNQATMAAS